MDQEIYHELAFKWWVDAVLRKRLRIISLIMKINAHYLNKTHKFGIEVPKSVAQAYALDKKNVNTLWTDAIAKEMKDVIPSFKKLYHGEIVPIGYQWINCHMIFDVKMEDFRRKARLVAGGHMTDPPATITYAILVSREKFMIALKLADLNDFPVKVVGIQNSYVTVPVTENIWTELGNEFGEYAGRKAIVVCALYGLNSAGAAFQNHLTDCMHHLGFLPCTSDLDIWMKPMVRPDDGFNYYAYVLIYVDNVMFIHHDVESVLRRIYKHFKLKPSSIGDPDIYFGDKLNNTRLDNGVWAWANIPERYVKELVTSVGNYLAELADARWQFPKKKY